MALLLHYFRSAAPPASASAMSALVLLSSCRRSLFAGEKERARFLSQLMGAVREIVATRVGLQARSAII